MSAITAELNEKLPFVAASHAAPPKCSEVLLLSSSLLTDRMFLYTGFLAELQRQMVVRIWATSLQNPRCQELWSKTGAAVEEFPKVEPFREFPHNYLRRLNEFVWDFRQQPPSRLSVMRHIRDKSQRAHVRALKVPARALAFARAEQKLEDRLEKFLLSYPRSEEALARLRKNKPHVLLTTGPFQYEQPAIVGAARQLGIPVLALIPSWDNLSTKSRMVFKYDGYLVWSEQNKEELHHFYPHTRQAPVYVVGAPQFDLFFQTRFHLTRGEFCATQKLREDLPIIVYAVGSPNFIREQYGAVEMAKRVVSNEFGNVQMIVRPHPIHDNAEMKNMLGEYAPRVVLQQTAEAGTALTKRSQDESQIVEWINTFRHADVVVNLSSTVTIDAAVCDRPVVNLDYDPEPGQPNQALIRDVNHLWTHFKPIAESGGVWLTKDAEETARAVKVYLQHPELHREQRRSITRFVCGYVDGRNGERMAQAVVDFSGLQAARSQLFTGGDDNDR